MVTLCCCNICIVLYIYVCNYCWQHVNCSLVDYKTYENIPERAKKLCFNCSCIQFACLTIYVCVYIYIVYMSVY